MEEVSPEERQEAIRHIVKLYEKELADVIKTGDRFEVKRLPPVMRKAISLVVAKSPAFSNISACTTANYVFTHLVGQLRPKINDIIYSNDILGINYYGVNIASSGSGKDSSYNTLMSACSTAFTLIEQERKDHEEARAKRITLRIRQQEDPNVTEADLVYADYSEMIRDLPTISAESASTRGGLTSLITRLADQPYGNLGITMNEFGLDLKSGQTTQDVLTLQGTLFDMGNAHSPAFKTEEVRERAIESMYPNMLLHSSPKIVFGDPKVRDTIAMLFHTMMARRCWYSQPTEEEAIENNFIPTSIAEVRKIANERRVTISTVSSELDTLTADVIRTMLADEMHRLVNFAEDSAQLYTDYFEYNAKRAELEEDSSIPQVEMNGRAFKVARLAAMWTLLEGTTEITHEILSSAIYFAEYNARYLETFLILTSAKAYRLLGDKFKDGSITQISLDTAIQNGYVSRITNDFKDLIDPMNSYLAKSGIVLYNADDRIFYYSPFKKVDATNGFGMSYTKVPGVAKDDRTKYLGNFEIFNNLNMNQLIKIVSTDTIFNTFKFKDKEVNGEVVKMKRSTETIDSATELLTLDVDHTSISMEAMHGYLSEYKHIISSTSDKFNEYKYRILLPVNVEVPAELYRNVMNEVIQELIITADPASCVPAQAFYGYEGANVLSNFDGDLYDVREFLHSSTSMTVKQEKPKTAVAKKKLVADMMANVNQVFDFAINAPKGGGSLALARASLYMADSGFTKENYGQVIRYINSMWNTPMDEDRLERTILTQFLSKMED